MEEKDEPMVNHQFWGTVYIKREERWLHVPYERELLVLEMVKDGDVEGLEEFFRANENLIDFHNHLSGNPVRQRMYELVATITLLTRWAVEGGLDGETAYSLADAYIRTADGIESQNEIILLALQAPFDFAERVRSAKRVESLSRPVLQCIEYIESNLHYPISLEDLATYTKRNASYISDLFKKEMGLSVTPYILGKRMDAAKHLLVHAELSVSQVAYTLGFTSQSYFSAVFKKHTGDTPRQYRNKCFRNHQPERSPETV